MSKRDIQKLRRLGSERIDLSDSLIKKINNTVKRSEPKLLDSIIKNIVDKFDIDENKKIRATSRNMRLLSNFNEVFSDFANDYGIKVANEIYKGLNKVTDFNKEYFNTITNDTKLIADIDKKVFKVVDAWLGVSETKGVVKNGYLHKIIQSDEVRLEVQTMMNNAIIGRKGWMETKQELSNKIVGVKDGSKGALEKYHRNFVYDTYAVVDRASADIYRSDLGLQFAIYEGGIIKTTRPFCKKHNGNVYHVTEIEAFNPPGDFPNYDPFLHLGKYSCRHYLNWITDAYALMLRPDVIKFLEE